MSCFCGNPAVVRTSWTNINPGRRFQACSQVPGCGFFVWVDPPMCARAIAIIPGLLRTRMNYNRLWLEWLLKIEG